VCLPVSKTTGSLLCQGGSATISAEYIQATSRVGRDVDKPGLVVTILNVHRPRDRLPWVDFQGSRLVLPATFAKSNEDQWVPLHPVLRDALAGLPRVTSEVFPFQSKYTGQPLSRNGITSTIRNLARKAGVKLSMHRLRKGFGCRVAQQLGKGNAPLLHELMRHSSMQITMDYYANVGDALQDAINGLV
jgi:integrase